MAALRTCWGQRGGDTHAWLEVNGRILDITADQFGEGCPAVWVPPDRRWHDAFKGGAAKEPDIFFEAAPHYASDMATAYVRVRQTIAFDQ